MILLTRWLLTSLSFFIGASLTGCWDFKDIEHMYFVDSIGVDYQHGQYRVLARVIDFAPLSTQEGTGSNEATGAWIGQGEGTTLDYAFHDLYSTTQRTLFWGQLKSLVVTEATVRHEASFKAVLDLLSRYWETRYSTWLFVTSRKLTDVLSVNPILERSPIYSIIDAPDEMMKQSSFTPPVQLFKFLQQLQEPGGDAVLPDIQAVKSAWNNSRGKPETSLRIRGWTLFHAGHMVGFLSRYDETGWQWVRGQVLRIPVQVVRGGHVVMVIGQSTGPATITPQRRFGRWVCSVKLSMKFSTIDETGVISDSTLVADVQDAVRRQILRTYHVAGRAHCDIYGLHLYLYRKGLIDDKEGAKWDRPDRLGVVRVKAQWLGTGRTDADPQSGY